MNKPLIVCYGLGVDSTAILVELHNQGVRPDAILHAWVGAERQGTYDYIPIIDAWLKKVGFPPITYVQYQCKDFKHWPPYHDLLENCLTNGTLPSIAYGYSKCSSKWKIDPQNKWVKQWPLAQAAWSEGLKVRKMVGFEDSPHEHNRAKGCSTYAIQDDETSIFDIEFPLQQWHWNRARCEIEILRAGLPVPPKSSCFFCTAMKPHEVDGLSEAELRTCVILEHRALPKSLAKAKERGWPNGEGKPLVHGLWRKPVKGMRGATPRPGSFTEYIREKGLLPSDEIDALKRSTPQRPLSRSDITSWKDWLADIMALSAM